MKRLLNHPKSFFKHIIEKKNLIFELTIRDFSSKYAESYLGNIWAVLDALLFIMVLWVIFGVGLRGGKPIMGVPYIVYLSVGFTSYWFLNTTITAGTNAFSKYSFLMHRVDFRSSILPVVMVLSNLLKHLCVLSAIVLILFFYGIWPTVYWLQIFYYIVALGLFALGAIWITSAIKPFFPDIQNIINVIMRVFFFCSPIFWSPEVFSEKTRMVLSINPLYYIMIGYRESLIFQKPLWDHPIMMSYFWVLTVLFVFIGMIVHIRLKPHFMDVL